MRYYADECLDREIVLALRAIGADVVEAARVAKGAPDPEVLEHGCADERVVLTEDKGFGALVFTEGRASSGVILVRIDFIDSTIAQSIAQRILALPDHGRGAFTTLELGGERTRALP